MPQVTVRISQPLKKITEGTGEVSLTGNGIEQILENLDLKYPGIRKSIINKNGKIKRYINIYINEENIRNLDNLSTEIKDGDEVSILSALAGG